MKIRKASFVFVMMLLPAAAQAGRHRPEAAIAPPITSYLSGSSLRPWRVSFAVPVFPEEWDTNLVADVSRYTSDENELVVVAYLVGLRWTTPPLLPLPDNKRALGFVQVLVGGADRTETVNGLPRKEHSLGFGLNVGTEWPNRYWVRPRLQFDVMSHAHGGERDWGFGFSVGVSFGNPHH